MNYNTKPLILVFPFGLLSHYLRCIVLADHLKEKFTLKFAAHPEYSAFAEAEGYGMFECAYMNGNEAVSGIKDFDFSWLHEQNLEQTFLSQVKAIEKLKPVAVIGDSMPTLKMAAEYTGIKYISLMNGYMTRYFDGYRSLPKNHPVQKILKKLPEHLKQLFTVKGESIAFKRIHKPFRKLRNRYGLKKTKGYLEEIEGDYNLICDLPYLFPQKELPENFQVIGPLIYTGNKKHTASLTIDPGKKTIYVTMGSSGNFKYVSFLNNEYYIYNIICAGDKAKALNAAHIQHADFIPAENVLPYTGLIICHGGNGTIYQALLYKIPVLCRPYHFEQEWNADAVENKDLGRSIDNIACEDDYKTIIAEWIKCKQLPLRNKTEKLINEAIDKQAETIVYLGNAIIQKYSGLTITEQSL
jgi:UDP:flavonoid glycosyltransferase YjiC (YdhE family)